ncbi:single-stranded DNA-binding protein [Streptomyces sp. NPDC056652]|uniref:single-stranded DNA-binding protein n=1 Tax=Streptomyces sp. NPDC056652 TaxID=3345893 RepID=UPI003698A85C
MSGETVICVVGNLVADPERRFTPGGAAVAKFTVASTPRVFDKQTNEWKDGPGLFLTCSVWRQQAEHAAESLTKGMRVIVQGRLKQRSFEDREGVKRTVFELDVEEVGPSLLRATAVVSRVAGKGAPEVGEARRSQGRVSSEDPWQQQQRSAGGGSGGWGGGDEPPF